MAEIWPSSLQQCLNSAGWSYSAEETNIRTNVDTGPKKVRRRYTRPDKLMQANIWFDKSFGIEPLSTKTILLDRVSQFIVKMRFVDRSCIGHCRCNIIVRQIQI